MEKQKKIKAKAMKAVADIKNQHRLYIVNGDELRKKLMYIELPNKYQWIVLNNNINIFLEKVTIEELNKIWKNRKK